MKMTDLIRVKTAGDRMGVTSQYIYTLIKDKRLNSVEIDGVTFVNRNEVDKFDAERKVKEVSKVD